MPKTTIHLELELEIDFEYQKAERMTQHYPGCPETVEVNALFYNGIELEGSFFDLFMEKYSDEITEACWDEVKDNAQAEAEARWESMREEKMLRGY